MQTLIIERTGKFMIERDGNGLTIRMVNCYQNREMFFQGDDADQFSTDYAAIENPSPRFAHKPRDWFLSMLWEEYETISSPLTSALERLDLTA